MKKILRSAAALALAGCMMSGNVLAAAPTFTDVPSTYWGYTYITKAAEKGLVSGVGNGLYGVSSTLSAAQFATMVCNLLYKDDVTAYQTANKTADWWGPYMAVAYSKGILKNTVAGDARTINGSWTTDMVNAEINRYDMAQVMYNVASIERWDMPTSAQLEGAKSKIGDWTKVPSKYQTAVKTAYAKSFLSGMDDGTFSGESQMTRAQGAVVLCKLLDAKTAAEANVVATPKFTNTTKLVNGKEATEANVVAALKALKTEYPSSYIWNMKAKYKSVVLGNGEGSDAFSYMLADKVFGNFALSAGTVKTLKPGDVVYLADSKRHVVVTDVYEKEFDYVCCDSVGKINWNNTLKLSALTSQNVIYTRYEGEGDYTGDAEETLTNGKKATESNVKSLIKTFLKGTNSGEYAVGDAWKNKSYTSKPFYSKAVTGNRAFAYYLSDYVFGKEAEVNEVDDFDDLRVGDVIYWDDEEEYLVVSVIDDDELTCVGVYNEKVYEHEMLVDELDEDDEAYTRYPDATADEDDDEDDDNTAAEGELTNGKEVTAANVKNLIKSFRKDTKSGYDDGDDWKDTKKYTSTAFYKKSVTGSRAFAYYLSDYIFGDDAKVNEVDDYEDLRTGDVIYWDDIEEYLVITNIDDDEIDYIAVSDEEVYSEVLYLDELDEDDSAWTRYPEKKVSKTLSNGKEVNETNVKALLTQFNTKEYEENDKWDDSYRSKYFSTSRVYDDQAFAYYLSDYIFGSLAVAEVEDFEDLRVGDVVYINDKYSDEFVVITDVEDDTLTYIGVWEEVVYVDEIDVSDLGTDDEAWTRYVEKAEEKEVLANGKTVSTRNVRTLISEFLATHKDGAEWASNKTYVPNKTGFGTRVVAGDKALAYSFSDAIFGKLSVTKFTDMEDLRIGDVLYYADWDEWLVVTTISGDELELVGVDPEEYEIYTTMVEVEDLDEDSYAYTRYPK